MHVLNNKQNNYIKIWGWRTRVGQVLAALNERESVRSARVVLVWPLKGPALCHLELLWADFSALQT